MNDVITIGSTTMDFFWNVNFDLVDFSKSSSGRAFAIPYGEKFRVENTYTALGGNAANASVTFARQGLATSVFTKIGDDVEGKEVTSLLEKDGVDCSSMEISNDKNTAKSMLLLRDAERTILTHHGSIDDFSLDGIDMDKLKAKWWYVSLPGKSYKLFDRLLDYAHNNDIKVALNPSSGHLEGDGKEYLLSHLKQISFLVLNEEEAKKIVGDKFDTNDKVFNKLNEMTPGIIAITLGKDGVIASDGNCIYKTGIFKNNALKDRTGAGDAFGSGFVAGLLHTNELCKKGLCNSKNIEYSIRLASANATSVVEQIGSTDGILTVRDFENNKRWEKLKIEISK